MDLFLHILPDSNQNRTENIAKNIKKSVFYTEYLDTKWRQCQTFERHDTSQQCQRGAQRFREQKDQRNDQSRPLCVLRLIKSLNLVIVN